MTRRSNGTRPTAASCVIACAALVNIGAALVAAEGDPPEPREPIFTPAELLAREKAAAARIVLSCGRVDRDEAGHVVAVRFTSAWTAEKDLAHLRRLPHVERLHLAGGQYTDQALAPLADLANLKSLTLAAPITDNGLAILAKLTQLEELYLSEGEFTGQGLLTLQSLTNLKFLYVGSAYIYETTPELAALRKVLPQTAIGVSPADKQRVIAKLRKAGAFVSVDSQGMVRRVGWLHRVKPEALGQLRGVPELQILVLSGTDVTDESLAAIPRLPALHSLDLSNTQISDEGLQYARRLKNLRHLALHESNVTDKGAAALKRELPDVNIFRIGIGLDPREMFARFTTRDDRVVEAELTSETIDEDLARLREFPDIRQLELRDCQHLTGKGLANLKHNVLLEELNLAGTKITDADLDGLHPLKGLRLVFVGGTPVTAAGAERLRKAIPGLEVDTRPLDDPEVIDFLSESGAFIQYNSHGWAIGVNFERNTARDEHLAALKGLPQLQEITSWDGSRITDAGLAHLHELKQLRGVIIHSRHITQKGIDAVAKALPKATLDLDDLSNPKTNLFNEE